MLTSGLVAIVTGESVVRGHVFVCYFGSAFANGDAAYVSVPPVEATGNNGLELSWEFPGKDDFHFWNRWHFTLLFHMDRLLIITDDCQDLH